MSDLANRADDAAGKAKALEQAYAWRVWLTAVLTQTVQAETTIRYRIADLETEAERLRGQLEQTTSAIESLRRTIRSADEAIRRRLGEIHAAAAEAGRSQHTEAEPKGAIERPEPGRRPRGRRKQSE